MQNSTDKMSMVSMRYIEAEVKKMMSLGNLKRLYKVDT